MWEDLVKKFITYSVMAVAVMGFLIVANTVSAKENKVVIQISDDNPRTMNIVLNNAMNLTKALGAGGVDIEIVAYGPGLKMVHKDSKLRGKIQKVNSFGNVTFAVCANTMKNLKWTEKDLLADAFIQKAVVPGGVIRIMELQQQGYTYIRP